MTKSKRGSIDHILDEAAAQAEAADDGLDVGIPAHVKVASGGPRTRVLQVRLNGDELAAVEVMADSRGLPASTVVREMILNTLNPDPAQVAARRRLLGEFEHYLDAVGVPADSAYPRPVAEALVGKPPIRRGSRRATTRRRDK